MDFRLGCALQPEGVGGAGGWKEADGWESGDTKNLAHICLFGLITN